MEIKKFLGKEGVYLLENGDKVTPDDYLRYCKNYVGKKEEIKKEMPIKKKRGRKKKLFGGA